MANINFDAQSVANFAQQVVELLIKKHPGLVGADIEVKSVEKNNNSVLTGISIKKPGSNIAPILYMDKFYEDFLEGRSFDGIVEAVYRAYEEVEIPDFNPDDFRDFEKVKNLLSLKIVNAERNKELLERVPHFLFGDLAVIFYVEALKDNGKGAGTVTVMNSYAEIWGVSKETILSYAKESFARNPISIIGMSQFMTQLNPEMAEMMCITPVEREEEQMFVLTNSTKILGAVGLLLSEKLAALAEEVKANLYIIPSSIHELLLIPKRSGMELADLQAYVHDVNATQVEPQDVLSDTVYYYDREKKVVTIAETGEELVLKSE